MRNCYFLSLFILVMQVGTPLAIADEQIKMQGTFGEPWTFGTEVTLASKKQKADALIQNIYFRQASLGPKSDEGPVFYTNPDLFSVSGIHMTLMPMPKINTGETTKSYSKKLKDSLCDKDRPKLRAVEHVSFKPPKVEVGTSVEAANKFQRETLKRVRDYLAEGKLFQSTHQSPNLQLYFSSRVTQDKVTLAMQGYSENNFNDMSKFFSNQRWATTTDFVGTPGVAGSAQMMFLSVIDSKSGEKNIVPLIAPLAFDMAVVKRDRSTSVMSGKASLEDTLEPIDKSWRMSTPYPNASGEREFIKAYISKDVFFVLKDGKKFYPALKWYYLDLNFLTNGFVLLIPPDVQRTKFVDKGPPASGAEGDEEGSEDGGEKKIEKLSTKDALRHKDFLWDQYFKYFTKITEAPDKKDPDKINFEVTLDLQPFCRWGTPISDLVVTE